MSLFTEHPGAWESRPTGIRGKFSVMDRAGEVIATVHPRHPEAAKAFAALAEIVEALDNVTASLESVLVHPGPAMTEPDRMNRERLAGDARALADHWLRPEDEADES